MGFFSRLFGRAEAQETSSAAEAEEKEEDLPETFDELAEMRAQFPFAVSVFRGDRVEGELLRLRDEHRGTATPVIIGVPRHAALVMNTRRVVEDEEESAEETDAFDAEAWLAEARAAEEPGELERLTECEIDPEGAAGLRRLMVGHAADGTPWPEVVVALVPTPDPTLLPRVLCFSWWWRSEDGKPGLPVALARRWRERHGAEIAVMTFDTLEFTVERPPEGEAESLQLAQEHFLFSADTVLGSEDNLRREPNEAFVCGPGSLRGLAQKLRHSTRWTFAWV